MSAFVHVYPFPHQVTVRCPDCNIDKPYPNYREALDAAKLHNLFTHENSIQWVQ